MKPRGECQEEEYKPRAFSQLANWGPSVFSLLTQIFRIYGYSKNLLGALFCSLWVFSVTTINSSNLISLARSTKNFKKLSFQWWDHTLLHGVTVSYFSSSSTPAPSPHFSLLFQWVGQGYSQTPRLFLSSERDTVFNGQHFSPSNHYQLGFSHKTRRPSSHFKQA